MKKIFFVVTVVIWFCVPVFGLEFTPPIIVNQEISEGNCSPSLVVDDFSNIYVAWENYSDSGRVYFGMSSDMGSTWTTPSIRVNHQSGIWSRITPSTVVNSSGTIYITWTLWIDGGIPSVAPLMCSISSDGGYTWSEFQVDDGSQGAKMFSSLIVDQYDTLYAIWHDERISLESAHPYFAKSSDGINWWPVPNLRVDTSLYTGDHSYSQPRIAVDNAGVLYAIFHSAYGPNWEIYSTRCQHSIWMPSIPVTSGGDFKDYPDIASTAQGMLYATWYNSDKAAIFFSRSTDGGLSWGDTLRIPNTGLSFPRIATDVSDNIYLVWLNFSEHKVYLSMSEDSGSTWSVPIFIGDGNSLSWYSVSLYVTPNGFICVAWDDNPNIYFSYADNGSPLVTVLSPNGGEVFGVGDTCDITWFAEDNAGIDSISIFYSVNAGMGWDTIVTGEPNDSTYEWIIPDTLSDSCLIKILAYDPSLNIGEDQSDSLFSIALIGIEENIFSSDPFVLFQVSPNPFSKLTEISFGIGHGAKGAELKIFDATGRLVKSFNLTSGLLLPASTISWDGTDERGNEVQSGVYFCRLNAGDYYSTIKLLLVK